MRIRVMLWSLALLGALVHAGELTTTLFARTPVAGGRDLLAPRSVAMTPGTPAAPPVLYVLDGALREVVTFAPAGEARGARHDQRIPLGALGLSDDQSLPADPLLPIPQLAVSGTEAFLLLLDRPSRSLTISSVDGDTPLRTVTLPDHATNGAVALDADGRVVVAALRAHALGLELVLSREEGNTFVTLATLKDPCAGQAKHLALTGFALAADGRLAIGLAQGGAPAYAFIRSWLIQGILRDGAVTRDLQLTHHFSLLDGRGKPLDRFRAHVELAGRDAYYPAKACVPLFTALDFGPDEMVISGGHTLDPFLRVYDRLGGLRASFPRRGVGGQHLAILPRGATPRLFVTNATASRVDELALDGRVTGSLGTPLPFRLTDVAALAADASGVYVVTRGEEELRLLRFTAGGALAWARPVAPPAGMEKATPYLATLGNERVFLGWRQPDADGVGMVEVVLEDGARGVPLWREAWKGASASVTALNPTPLVAGRNGRLYVQRETKEGTRVQAFSPAGALMQTLPAAVGGVSAALSDSTLAWIHPGDNSLLLTQFSALGAQTGWKRLRPQPTPLVVTTTDRPWAWEPAAGTLLRMDNTLTIVEDLRVLAPNGARVTRAALAGDHEGRLYFAVDGQILAGEYVP